MNFLTRELLDKVARSREAELEASGRASGLQFAIEAMRGENAELRATNRQLINRLVGGAPIAQGPVSTLPTIYGGIPEGSPVPAHLPPLQQHFEAALPPVPAAAPRTPQTYGLAGDFGGIDPFADIGDREAERRGIRTDDLTGALEGGPSMPMPNQRTQ